MSDDGLRMTSHETTNFGLRFSASCAYNFGHIAIVQCNQANIPFYKKFNFLEKLNF